VRADSSTLDETVQARKRKHIQLSFFQESLSFEIAGAPRLRRLARRAGASGAMAGSLRRKIG
jgi:hypothetical protein